MQDIIKDMARDFSASSLREIADAAQARARLINQYCAEAYERSASEGNARSNETQEAFEAFRALEKACRAIVDMQA